MGMKRIEIQIDELVLNGFAAADRLRIADAIKQELARLVKERGSERRLSSQARDAGSFRVAPGANVEIIGRHAARSVHQSVVSKVGRR